jgi:hypothetical protein
MGRGNDFVLCTHPCIKSAADFNVAATRNGLDRVGIFESGSPTDATGDLRWFIVSINQQTFNAFGVCLEIWGIDKM